MADDAAIGVIERAWEAFHCRDFEGARGLWAEVRALLPDHPIGYLGDAHVLREAGQFSAGDAMLEDAIARFPDEQGVFSDYAWMALHRRDRGLAVERFATARQRFPDVAFIYVGSVQALRGAGRMADAEALASLARDRFPDDHHVRLEHAWHAMFTQDWAAASARWAAVRQALPDDLAGYLQGARALRGALRLTDAETLLTEATARFPDAPEPPIECAWLAHGEGRLDQASALFQSVRQRFPDNAMGWRGGYEVLRPLPRIAASEHILQEAITRFPDDPHFMLEYARVRAKPQHIADQDWPETIKRIEALLVTHPDFEDGFVEASQFLRDAGQTARAEEIAQASQARFPENITLAMLAADLAAARDALVEATDRYRAARQHFPNHAEPDIGLAQVLAREGRLTEAETVLITTMQAFPTAAAAARAYAELAERQENWRDAVDRWAAAEARFPTEGTFAVRAFEARLHLAERDPAPARSHLPRTQDDASATPRDIALRFESLGGTGTGCEFGIFQRVCGTEPLGLLRWTAITLEMLLMLLACRFEGVGAEVHTVLSLDETGGSRREYATGDRRGVMVMHTFVYDDQISAELMRVSALKRLRFLAAKLVDDLTEGKKIFVYHQSGRAIANDQIAALGQAVRTYGDNTLLYVQLADAQHPDGTVEVISPGLLVGYIERFMLSPTGLYNSAPATASWLAICRNVIALSQAAQASAVAMAPDPAASARTVMQFESLGGSGHGCEFGVMQRGLGAEPLGLLRFADLPYEALVAALEAEFDGVGDPANTIVFVPDGCPFFWSRDTRFWMAQGSSVQVLNTPIATATSRVCVRLRFLRQKLIEDLRDGGKIFVYKNNHRTLSDDELAGLHAAVRRYGDNTLLYVRVADAAHPNRSVAWAGPGLLVGAIEHFTHSPLPEDTFLGLATASWMEICQVAHGMWTKARLPSAQR